MRKLRVSPDGFAVDVLKCQECGATTVAHAGLRVPCEVCMPLTWSAGQVFEDDPGEAAKRWARVNDSYGPAGFEYVGRRVHVKAKKAPPSRAWVRHRSCGRIMPKVTPYPQDPRCPWCEELPDRSLAALGDLPGLLYLLSWGAGPKRFLKVGIGLADRPRIRSQVREGAEVLEVREATLLDCRRAEQRILKDLGRWRARPTMSLRLGGDTECLLVDAPIGRLRQWFGPGIRSRDVTRQFR